MSDGRAFRRQLVDLLAPLDGARIYGGCDDCDAYQTVTAESAGVWQIHVWHDDECPTYQQMVDKS
jgi:hypothetical protein